MGNLTLERISKSYGERRVLDELGFEVGEGELFGFVGSNGAGKTTTMRIVLGVLAADSGTVRWGGTPLDEDARREIGYMPEERGLYPKMKVREQLVYLARLRGRSAQDADRATDEWLERLGVAERGGDEVQKLSLGNQQRVQLAAALVHDPKILVLDEPFSGLDPVAVDVMSQVLRDKSAEGVPVVFSSHQLDLVERLCDRVGIIRGGRMVALGTTAELQEQGQAQLLCRVEGAADGWADAVPGVLAREGDLFTLAPDADEQVLLRAALAAGRVREFSLRRPTLTELFRDVVTGEKA
ncbi:ABC transporter ATP-binding protein [Actinocorallia populi]|uniref:ABC transporter ATP-binding protein n=1 Tax=Actinocorallia populi TaxID=2079200 RepID=UPI000D088395|nr:ATP-binding cassette domain-containing protein [Actinocorallia populi]